MTRQFQNGGGLDLSILYPQLNQRTPMYFQDGGQPMQGPDPSQGDPSQGAPPQDGDPSQGGGITAEQLMQAFAQMAPPEQQKFAQMFMQAIQQSQQQKKMGGAVLRPTKMRYR